MDFCFYSSRDRFFKSKFGAIAAGESLRLCILMPRAFGVNSARLVINRDGEETERRDMYWAGLTSPDTEVWDISFKLNEAGLYWYYFEYSTDFGDGAIRNIGADRSAVNIGESWQLTVYSPDYETPDWLKGGIIYQIFPDRFFNSKTPKKNVPESISLPPRT